VIVVVIVAVVIVVVVVCSSTRLETLRTLTAALDASLAAGGGATDGSAAATAAVRRASRAWTTSRRTSSRRATTMVMWQERFLMAPARPRARGVNRFMVGPSSAKHALTNSSSGSCSSLCGVGDGRGQHLAHHGGGIAIAELQHFVGLRTGRSRMRSRTTRAFHADDRTYIALALVPLRSPATNDFSLSFGPVISGDPSCSSLGRRGT
jgi:hypothetical protein